jgi:hypothetical protein
MNRGIVGTADQRCPLTDVLTNLPLASGTSTGQGSFVLLRFPRVPGPRGAWGGRQAIAASGQ